MAAAVAALTFTSCEDALDSNNYTKADTSNFPAANTDMNKELSAAYSVMNQFCKDPLQTPFMVYNLMSDDCNGGGGTGDVESHAIGHLMSNKATLYDQAWEATYVGINRVNTIITTKLIAIVGIFSRRISNSSQILEIRNLAVTILTPRCTNLKIIHPTLGLLHKLL